MKNTKIVFITFYDTVALGLRILSSIARDEGFEPYIIFLKEGKKEVPIWWDRGKNLDYSFFEDGILYGSTTKVDKVKKKEFNLVIDIIRIIDPELICVSTRSFGFVFFRELAMLLRSRIKEKKMIISGGWGPTVEPEKFLQFSDYVCLGEGEKTFKDILENLKCGEKFENIYNLAYIKNRKLQINPLYPPLSEEEISSLPLPDYYPENKYIVSNNDIILGKDYDQVSGYVCFASRGCPLSCSYCQSGQYKRLYKTWGHNCPKMRLRSVKSVIEELIVAKELGAKTIIMRDEVFPYKKSWISEFCSMYKEKISLPFFAYIRPEFHPKDIIYKLKETGLYLTRVGIQSGSDYVLKNIYNRPLKKEKTKEFAYFLDETGINFSYHLICNNPLEKEEHLIETLNFCNQLPFKSIRVFNLVTFPMTPLNSLIKDNKSYLPRGIHFWYAILYCMSVKNPFFRKLGKIIFKTKLFKVFPYPLQILFVLDEYIKKILK